jgi:hypothetical protein
MAVIYGHTGRVIYTDNSDLPARLSNRGSLMTMPEAADYEDAVEGGGVFVSTDKAAAVIGTAIPIYSSVTPVGDVLWNPAGSGVDLIPVSYHIEQVSGNPVVTPVFLMARAGAGSEIATGAVFSAFAKTTPANAFFGKGKPSKVYSSNLGTCTLTTAGAIGDVLYNLFGLPAVTAQAIAFTQLDYDFKGRLRFPPGSVVWVAGTVASVALYQKTWVWKEVPAA